MEHFDFQAYTNKFLLINEAQEYFSLNNSQSFLDLIGLELPNNPNIKKAYYAKFLLAVNESMPEGNEILINIRDSCELIDLIPEYSAEISNFIDSIICRMASQTDDTDYIIELMRIAKSLKGPTESLQAFSSCELKISGKISNYGLEMMNTDLNDFVLIYLNKIKRALEVNTNLSMTSNVILQAAKGFLEKKLEEKKGEDHEQVLIGNEIWKIFDVIEDLCPNDINLKMIKNNLENKYAREIESCKSVTGTEIYDPSHEDKQASFTSYKNISRQDFNIQGIPLRSHQGGINTYIYKIIYQGQKACIKVYNGKKDHPSFNDVEIEILILEELDKINSNKYLKYFGKCIVDENNSREVFIITEWIEKDLLQYIEEVYKNDLTIPEEKLKIMFKNLAEIYNNLHERRIFHMDIKPANILIDENDKLYVIDFNVSSKEIDVYTHSKSFTKGHAGTNGYMAPEIQLVADSVLQNEPVFEKNFRRSKADVFSLGMTFLHMFNLFKVGLNNIDKENDLKNVLKKVPEWAKNILEAMLDFNKAKRPYMLEVYLKLDQINSA